jgi:hypothetical protein
VVEFPFDASSNFGDGGGRLPFFLKLNLEILEPFDLSNGIGALMSGRGSAGGGPAVELNSLASDIISWTVDWGAFIHVE